jgi:cysteinyl-tRNA synthetase
MPQAGDNMALRIHNTLTRGKEEFRPLHGNRVSMFVCGLTVQGPAHVGHAKTYTFFDVVARYLRYRGYSVFYLQNVTDIDDKIINKAKEAGTDTASIAGKYFKEYLEDMDALNNKSVNFYAKATEYIPEIIDQIRTLIEKGYAYDAGEDVYYEVGKFSGFGKLSGQKLENLEAGARVEVEENKRNPEDFVLWKSQKPGEPFWESPWGKGRPGWHIEDTAITVTHFGAQYDIHGGATELMFPHHESEIAQAEAATGVSPFVIYWMHAGLLNIKGEKMSKSLGNFFTIREILAKYPSEVIRFFLINTHYRSPVDFYDSLLEEAKSSLERMKNTIEELRIREGSASDSAVSGATADSELAALASAARQKFIAHMDDDFNTREAIAALFEYTKGINEILASKKPAGKSALGEALALYSELGEVLGIFSDTENGKADTRDSLVALLVDIRENARKNRDFKTADEIRERLKGLGISLEDSAGGLKVKKG